MTRTWTLRWTGPPPPNQNGGVSRWGIAKSRRTWRANADVMAHAAAVPKRELVRVRLWGCFFRRALNVADPDGDMSRMKAVLDGLVAGLFLPDDTRRFVEWAPIQELHGPAGFTLTIEELEYDPDTAARARQRYIRFDDIDPLEAVRRAARRRAAAPALPGAAAAAQWPGGRMRNARRQRGVGDGG